MPSRQDPFGESERGNGLGFQGGGQVSRQSACRRGIGGQERSAIARRWQGCGRIVRTAGTVGSTATSQEKDRRLSLNTEEMRIGHQGQPYVHPTCLGNGRNIG